VETEKVWQYADEYDLAKIIFVNKMDKERADFYRALADIEKAFKVKPLPIFLPIGQEENFRGVIDLVKFKAYFYPTEPTANFKIEEIPDEFLSEAESYRNRLLEAISEVDDELIEKYLEGAEFTVEEIERGIREGTISKRFFPVIPGSAVKNIGSKLLLESIIKYLPSPIERERKKAIDSKTGEIVFIDPLDPEFRAFVFKTFIDPFAGKLTIFRVYSGEVKNDTEIYNVNKDETEKSINYIFFKVKTLSR